MPYCNNCRIQVQGNTCPRCGTVLAWQQPAQQQPYTQTPRPMPPPQQPPQYQQPQQPPRAYAPAQQPQAQPPYQVPYQPAAQMPPAAPKKSRKGPIIAVVCVVAILVVALLAYFLVLKPGEEDEESKTHITFNEFLNDMRAQGEAINFKSYDAGDEIYVRGTVEDIKIAYVPPGTTTIDPGIWTIISFENTEHHILGDMYNEFAYKGDLRSNYTVDEQAEITIHITEMMGSEIAKEWTDALSLWLYEIPYLVTLEFTEISPGSGNYTGSLTSDSDVVPLSELGIEIYDSSEWDYGYDDGDLTDDDPEVIITTGIEGDAYLEFSDENNDDNLDSGDTFTFYNAGAGDEIELSSNYDTLTIYTFT